jgi:hypothetical protein
MFHSRPMVQPRGEQYQSELRPRMKAGRRRVEGRLVAVSDIRTVALSWKDVNAPGKPTAVVS